MGSIWVDTEALKEKLFAQQKYLDKIINERDSLNATIKTESEKLEKTEAQLRYGLSIMKKRAKRENK